MDAARAQPQILPQMPDVPVTDDWTLHQGRAQDILPGEYAGRVNLIVTSPPYDGLRPFGGFISEWDFDAIADAVVQTLAPGGVLVWQVADRIVDGFETGTSFRQALAFTERGLGLHHTLIYEMNGVPSKAQNRYPHTHAYMFVLSSGRPAIVNRIEDVKAVRAGMSGASKIRGGGKDNHKAVKSYLRTPFIPRGSIWRYNIGLHHSHPGEVFAHEHPATFPYALAADHIRSWTNEGDLVLDPMAGSGTTLRAAVNLNRRAVGVEVNPDYCDLIRRRMAQQTLGL